MLHALNPRFTLSLSGLKDTHDTTGIQLCEGVKTNGIMEDDAIRIRTIYMHAGVVNPAYMRYCGLK